MDEDHTYVCTWSADVEASTPREAAAIAEAMVGQPKCRIWQVTLLEPVTIDLESLDLGGVDGT